MICPICGENKDESEFDNNGVCYDCESAVNTFEIDGTFDGLGGV